MQSATLKNHPNSYQNPPKTLPKPAFEKRRVQNTSPNPSLRHLGRFLLNFWRAPGAGFWILNDFWEGNWSLNLPKPPQKRQKNDIKNKYIFEHDFSSNFHRFSLRKWSPNRYFFENVDFVKINKNHWKTNGFYWFFKVRPSKTLPKNVPKSRSKTTSKKKLQKSIFASILASQNLPKSLQNRSNIEKNRIWKQK